MFVHVHVETMTEYAPGAVMRAVRCERCQTQYFYELARVAKGTGSAVYGIGKEAARRRAKQAAQKKLIKLLDGNCEAVPCPKCGWIQDDMVRDLRRHRHRGLRLLMYACVSLTLLSLFCAGMFWLSDAKFFDSMTRLFTIPTIGVAAVGTGLHAFRAWRVGAYDPNQESVTTSAPPLRGTPPALRCDAHDKLRIVTPEPCGSGEDGTVVVQTARCTIPRRCCSCLGPADKWRKPAFCDTGLLSVGICKRCWRAGNWLVVRALLVVLVAPAAIAWLGSMTFTGLKPADRYLIVICGGIALALVVSVIYTMVAPRPFRGKWVDRRRGVVRLTFRNRDFARMVAERYQARVPDRRLPSAHQLA